VHGGEKKEEWMEEKRFFIFMAPTKNCYNEQAFVFWTYTKVIITIASVDNELCEDPRVFA
jgi:hypothetical protein